MDVVKDAYYFSVWENKWSKILKEIEKELLYLDKKDKKHFVLTLLHEEMFRFIVDINNYSKATLIYKLKDGFFFRRNNQLSFRRKYLNQTKKTNSYENQN